MRWLETGHSSLLSTLLWLLGCASALGAAQQFIYKKQYAMGTVYEIAAYDPSPERASKAIEAAFHRIVELDHMMSNFDESSDLSRLNRSAHFHAEPVPADLYRAIQDSLIYSRLSGGKFDISVAPLVDAWKAAQTRGQPLSASVIEKLRRCVGYQQIEMIPPNRIEFHSPCLRIDLGAIGKGYAVDRAAEALRSYGLQSALINAGGSTIYALGAPPGQPGWLVHLRDPSRRLDPTVLLQDDSVSTSEQNRSSLIDPEAFGHIINPFTDRPVNATLAVSVVARTAVATDGLSTTLFLMGPQEGGRLVRRLPDVAALWVSPAGKSNWVSTGPQIMMHHSAIHSLR
jgi:thiamine biosynthesis lipoprotein